MNGELLDVVFDGPPSHEPGRFVEVENMDGASVRVGEWIDRGDGYWALRLRVIREQDGGPLDNPPLPDGISRCGQLGYHVYMAGPCFDRLSQAVAYKASLDAEGVKWRPQP